jgi:hypothetical protein
VPLRHYLASAFLSQDATCFLLFHGPEPVEVERALKQAEITCQRVVPAVYLPAQSEPPDTGPLDP